MLWLNLIKAVFAIIHAEESRDVSAMYRPQDYIDCYKK